jgi:hypothetical protein
MSYTGQPVDDPYLLIGQQVEVVEHGEVIDHGHVEDVTEDGLILWLTMDGANNRRLIELDPQRELRVRTDAADLPN